MVMVMVMMTLIEILTSVMLVRHSIQNMAMMMKVSVILKKCRRHNNLAVTVNDAASFLAPISFCRGKYNSRTRNSVFRQSFSKSCLESRARKVYFSLHVFSFRVSGIRIPLYLQWKVHMEKMHHNLSD